jgi:aspartyl-tRNA(Asn)/glutamyl-tRNA(Gln) amidotransferase subunit C
MKLARIGLSAEEQKRYEGQLAHVLGYINELKKVDTEQVEPTSHATGQKDVYREDVAAAPVPEAVAELVSAAPKHEKGFVKVRQVL